MKKCPFCAEQIQDEAKVCRYCDRQVTGILFRRIIRIAVLIAIASALFINRQHIMSFARDTKNLIADIKERMGSTLKSSGGDLMSVDEVKRHIETINSEIERIRNE